MNYGRFIDPSNAKAWFGLIRPTDTGLILRNIVTDFKFVGEVLATRTLQVH